MLYILVHMCNTERITNSHEQALPTQQGLFCGNSNHKLGFGTIWCYSDRVLLSVPVWAQTLRPPALASQCWYYMCATRHNQTKKGLRTHMPDNSWTETIVGDSRSCILSSHLPAHLFATCPSLHTREPVNYHNSSTTNGGKGARPQDSMPSHFLS